jgi:hypothetical protein
MIEMKQVTVLVLPTLEGMKAFSGDLRLCQQMAD